MAAAPPALTIRRTFPRPDDGLIGAFTGVPTGNVCDAQGRKGALDAVVQPLTTRSAFAGPALTVHAGPRDNLAPWAALGVARPGDVLVIATGGYRLSSVVGDVYVGMARNCGIAAIVTDGMVRDVAGIEATGVPVFAAGVSPNSPEKNGPGEIGLTVVCGGRSVTAGDIVVGDADGVVVVGRTDAADVQAALQQVFAKEKAMEAQVAAGDKTPPWLAEAMQRLGTRYLDD